MLTNPSEHYTIGTPYALYSVYITTTLRMIFSVVILSSFYKLQITFLFAQSLKFKHLVVVALGTLSTISVGSTGKCLLFNDTFISTVSILIFTLAAYHFCVNDYVNEIEVLLGSDIFTTALDLIHIYRREKTWRNALDFLDVVIGNLWAYIHEHRIPFQFGVIWIISLLYHTIVCCNNVEDTSIPYIVNCSMIFNFRSSLGKAASSSACMCITEILNIIISMYIHGLETEKYHIFYGNYIFDDIITALLYPALSYISNTLHGLKMLKEYTRCCGILFLSITVPVCYFDSEQVLMSLAATYHKMTTKHIRIISVFICIIMHPLLVPLLLPKLSMTSPPFVMFVILSIQAFGSLIKFFLIIHDSMVTKHFESLDTLLFSIQFSIDILGVLVEVWAVCLQLHLLFTKPFVWHHVIIALNMAFIGCIFAPVKIKLTYNSYLQRQKETEMVKSFDNATSSELHNFDDVCSICYRSLQMAKRTPCGHYFHGNCLKKWLFSRQTCPLCNTVISTQTGTH